MNKTGIPSLHVEEQYMDEKRLLEVSFFNSTSEGANLSLFNVEGHRVLQEFVSHRDCIQSVLDISFLSRGEYTLFISNSQLAASKKVLISDWS